MAVQKNKNYRQSSVLEPQAREDLLHDVRVGQVAVDEVGEVDVLHEGRGRVARGARPGPHGHRARDVGDGPRLGPARSPIVAAPSRCILSVRRVERACSASRRNRGAASPRL